MISQLFLLLAATLIFLSAFSFLMFFAKNVSIQKQSKAIQLWNKWKRFVPQEDSVWDLILQKAGKPFGWGKAEWLSLQIGMGSFLFLFTFGWYQFTGFTAFSLFWIVAFSILGYLIPFFIVKYWANYREELLSVDIARFINRYVNLLENQVPPYFAMVKAARPTKLLKNYIPSLSEWNRNRLEALDKLKLELGVDDAVILVSNMRTIEHLSSDVMAYTMQRLEFMVDNRRMFRHRKKIKSLGIGYSVIVYPAFYVGLIVAMFPWYKLLSELLDRYLV